MITYLGRMGEHIAYAGRIARQENFRQREALADAADIDIGLRRKSCGCHETGRNAKPGGMRKQKKREAERMKYSIIRLLRNNLYARRCRRMCQKRPGSLESVAGRGE